MHWFPESVTVEPLNDEESEILAQSKPHLRPLLFGQPQVKEIVRRPFFAKILDQSYVADPNTPPPQSEVDLIENWWARGGYNASGQDAIGRQGAIIDLAAFRARHLSGPIAFSATTQQSTVAKIDELVTDGILQQRHVQDIRFVSLMTSFLNGLSFMSLWIASEEWLKEIQRLWRAAGCSPRRRTPRSSASMPRAKIGRTH